MIRTKKKKKNKDSIICNNNYYNFFIHLFSTDGMLSTNLVRKISE